MLVEKPMAKSTARNKMMDYLAVRDHSELELRKKLATKFERAEIDRAIEFAKENKWLPQTPQEEAALSQRAAATLSRKKKGIGYINMFLQEIGLPQVSADPDLELAKAEQLVKNKLRSLNKNENADGLKVQLKISRFLQSRGFQHTTIREVLKNAKFKNKL